MLIVGAGQSGLVIAFALMRERVRNILLIDRAPDGREGPWVTFARMPTLRSPKDQTGPGPRHPEPHLPGVVRSAVRRRPPSPISSDPERAAGTSTCMWYRRVLELPVRNDVEATAIAPGTLDDGGRCLLVTLSTGEVLAARKLVLATGQDGTGEWWMPDFVRALPARSPRPHLRDAIDFERLRGRIVAVLGVGASAMDNAAVALEHGAAEVHPSAAGRAVDGAALSAGSPSPGFLQHMGDLPDEWRWRIMGHIMRSREGFPSRHLQARARLSQLHHACSSGPGRTPAWKMAASASRRRAGRSIADYAICGTGIRQNVPLRPELAPFADKIAPVGRSLHAAAGRGGSDCFAAYPLPRARLRLPGARAGRGAVARRHPSLRHRLDAELRAVGQQHQRA